MLSEKKTESMKETKKGKMALQVEDKKSLLLKRRGKK